ncbi:MAG TPA: thioredoxin family protein [Spirochaetota bacterium]|nr:thioredoxin family protein [Spirochaetota bacterium]HPQ54214.1 thioredoxin family protein [Spirochaetota bacterium]
MNNYYKPFFKGLLLLTAVILIAVSGLGRCENCNSEGTCNDEGGIHAVSVRAVHSEETVAVEKKEAMVTFVELGSINCIPCRMMQPVMEKVQNKYGARVKVIFYDVWTPAGRPYAQRYGIQAIPTQVFLDKHGKEYFRHQGFLSFENIEEVLRKGGIK